MPQVSQASRIKGWPHSHVMQDAGGEGSPAASTPASRVASEELPRASAHFVSHGELPPEEMLKEMSPDDALHLLQSDRAEGLTQAEVERRLELFGPNAVPEKKRSKILVFLSFMWCVHATDCPPCDAVILSLCLCPCLGSTDDMPSLTTPLSAGTRCRG